VDGLGGTQTLLQSIELGIRHSKCRVIRLIQNFVLAKTSENLSQKSSRWVKVSFSQPPLENTGSSSGGMPSYRCYNSGCLALYMCKTSPWTLPQDSKSISCTFTATIGVLVASGESNFCFPNLPVLVKAILCIGKDLGISTVAYAPLMVQLQQDGYTSKARESQNFERNWATRFLCLGVASYLPVLYFPASDCQSFPMYR